MKPPPLRTALVIVLAARGAVLVRAGRPRTVARRRDPAARSSSSRTTARTGSAGTTRRCCAPRASTSSPSRASAALNAQTLAGYQVVLLAETTLSAGQASVLGGWVNGGGNLIAMRPDADLAGAARDRRNRRRRSPTPT